jgi:polyisoprenoid-binding protein YceI
LPWPALAPGEHRFGPPAGRLTLRTGRQGVASRAGHDLLIELTGWSARLQVPETGVADAELDVDVDMTSFRVLEGTGGVKPLTDGDRREIAATAAKVLQSGQHPHARFQVAGLPEGGGLAGELTLLGRSRPLQLQVSVHGDQLVGQAVVVQSDWGIKPYTGFLGALRVRDEVGVQVELPVAELGR